MNSTHAMLTIGLVREGKTPPDKARAPHQRMRGAEHFGLRMVVQSSPIQTTPTRCRDLDLAVRECERRC
jgi:hypothetical protein